MRRVLLVGMMLASCAVYGAAPNEFMGLTIGGAFKLSECTWHGKGVLATYDYWFKQPIRPCWQHNTLKKNPGDPLNTSGTFEANFLPAKQYSPSGIDINAVSVIVVNGRISGVMALTRGYKVQDDLFELLSEKYGKPKKKTMENLHNAMGATFTGISARWVEPDLVVVFEGIGSRIDSGIVTVLNPDAVQFEANEEKKRKETSGSF